MIFRFRANFKDNRPLPEETLDEALSYNVDTAEVPLSNEPFFYLGLAVLALGLTVAAQIVFLGVFSGDFYRTRAQANLNEEKKVAAPRGLILDRFQKVLAENRPVFFALLDTNEFLRNKNFREETLNIINKVLGISANDVLQIVGNKNISQINDPILLNTDLTSRQTIELKSANLPTIIVENGFQRQYPDGRVFSHVIGYTGLVTADDLKINRDLTTEDVVGKTGLEAFYDEILRGQSGSVFVRRDAQGAILDKQEVSFSQIGKSLDLTIDADFQKYFYNRLAEGLRTLGRQIGVGIAMNPQNGEILALVGLPGFDNNIMGGPGNNDEKISILSSSFKPLFNRAVSGLYNPGSTIKPLVAIAALEEGIIDPRKEIFSPGYLDIPNPYYPDQSTRYLDWRYQGNVSLAAAIAQSSNVYFYTVGGGAGSTKGLGINRLLEWWQKFGLGNLTGIDLPGEAKGFLPSIEWRESSGRPWLLGDTYNVSIGQGDLLLTPLQILNYVGAIANGGKIYRPVISQEASKRIITDLSELGPQLKEVQKGMRQTVTSPRGTAHLLADLSFSVGAKTGSAQVENNQQENAFFVGYAPAENPQVAILVLIEHSREGSLNAVPIAKDVLNWYYENRLRK